MAFFWFLIALVLFLVVISRKKEAKNDDYAQGYWDGYRSFGDQLQSLLTRQEIDRQALQKLIDTGNGNDEPVYVNEPPTASPLGELPVEQFIEPQRTAQPLTVTSPILTPQQQAARSLRNLNTILYMASFLLVAAGALFVAAGMPDVVKLVGVWLIITVFYGAGFILSIAVQRLRPAALAFLGTGMALIPFGGVALGQYTHLGAEVSWFITSIIGLAAYALAAIRLRSQLVSYLTMASVLSLAGSAAATAQSGLMGEFIVLIVVSLLANVVATLQPRWIPAVFRRPIEQTGQVVTPIVLLASVVLISRLTISDYEAISLVALLHYVVAWAQVHSRRIETAIRILASIVVLIFVYDFSNTIATVAFAALLVASLQQVYSLMMSGLVARRSAEEQWIGGLFIIQVLAFMFWQQSEYVAVYNVTGLVLIGLVGLAAALRLRVVWPAVIGLAASIIAPLLIARQLFVPSLPWWLVAASYILLAVAALVGYLRMRHHSAAVRAFMVTAESIYLGLACIIAMADSRALTALLIFGAAAIIIHATSHFVRRVWVQVLAAFLLLIAVGYASAWLHIAGSWSVVFTGGVTAAILWIVTVVYTLRGSLRRTTYSFASAQAALAVVGGATFGGGELVDRWVVAIFVVAIIATVFIRSQARAPRSALAIVATISYIGYFVLAVGAASHVSTGWTVSLWVFGAALFTNASYIERQPAMQLLSTLCVVPALSLVASLVYVPVEWLVLFVTGGTALVHYAAASLHAAFAQADRQFIMTAAGQAAVFASCLGLVSNDVYVTRATTAVLLVVAAVSFAARWWNRDRSRRYSILFMVSYIALYGVGLLAALQLSLGWGVVAFGLGAAIFWSASYAERQPQLLVLGNALFVFATLRLWLWAGFDNTWLIIGCTWIIASVLYLGYGIFIGRGDRLRERMMLWSVWAVLGFGGFIALMTHGLSTAVALLLLGLATTFSIEAYRRKNWPLGEAALYLANFAIQRLFGEFYPELNIVFYAHWWALTVAALALIRGTGVRPRLVVAMSFVTLSSGLYALGQGGGYQLLFLAEHLALLVIGALRQKNWAIWWGIAASAVAILYFLRSYTFLWLGFLGLLLIAVVIWRLMRTSQR